MHASRAHSIINFHERGALNRESGLFAISACKLGFDKAFTLPSCCRAFIFLNFSNFEPRIIFKLLLYL